MPRAKKSTATTPTETEQKPVQEAPQPVPPPTPSPAVIALQQQAVDLVSKRTEARAKLNEAHGVYLMAQSKFQAAEAELQGIEQEIQYRIGLIAQLENRQPAPQPGPALVQPQQEYPPMPAQMEVAKRQVPQGLENAARASAADFRSQFNAT